MDNSVKISKKISKKNSNKFLKKMTNLDLYSNYHPYNYTHTSYKPPIDPARFEPRSQLSKALMKCKKLLRKGKKEAVKKIWSPASFGKLDEEN